MPSLLELFRRYLGASLPDPAWQLFPFQTSTMNIPVDNQ